MGAMKTDRMDQLCTFLIHQKSLHPKPGENSENQSRSRGEDTNTEMLQNHKVLKQSPFQFLNTPKPSASPLQVHISNPPSFHNLKQRCKVSRRELTISSNSTLFLLLASQSIDFSNAQAEESEEVLNTSQNDKQEETMTTTTEESEVVQNTSQNDKQEEETMTTSTPTCSNKEVTKQAFLDISIDREPAGRITIGLYGHDIPVGAARFSSLVSGPAGISYRRKEFIKIMPNYVQHTGVRSYGVDAELAYRSGSDFASGSLVQEWEKENEKCPGTKNLAGTVSIIVRDPSKPPPKLKLIAKNGKLEIDQEEIRADPNGTEFIIAINDSPELDSSTLVVGRVLGGMEVVEKIRQVKTVQENTSSPYFRAAKLIGDKRAVVAERGFNRPYSKVVVTNCGLTG
ncbi:Peptidyl-prolyl cis-trans isomerase B [Tripterygium wilfordii]|uniref:Peptidyl-prolyl cis-trans isomerase B n=1 Tax=Tripterygium wilfordii TaxID=458696 RepID=A0A7J7CKS8_TRIWF|nr:peptidyl-prolyl cis-trans isomerase CYP26-2, chloroplastic [Tripterygium wilfordii]KAF5734621.1 Peptidyl-prolyl cis-trans isomerase B [Tripterygium wilfordii]